MKRSLYKCVPTVITIIIIVVVFQLALACIIMNAKVKWQGPTNGLWYCNELQIQLCFEPNNDYIDPNDSIDSRSYALVDGHYVMCDVRTDVGTYTLCIIHQDISDESNVGDTIFEGEFDRVAEREFEVCDKEGATYVFNRVEEFSFNDKLDNCAQQVAQYNGVKHVGITRHVVSAIQKATQLWDTELGINITDQTVVEVAFDFTTECWYVSVLSPTELTALIDYNGNVLGVWGGT